jgi:hypothetical protein
MTATPLTAGYHHGVPLLDYVRDPAPEPSLSTGTVADLVTGTPQLAHLHHPRLGKRPSESTSRGDIGSAVHAALLGGAPVLYAPDAFKDWRKDAAKDFRDGVRADGGIPLLAHERSLVERATAAGRRVLSDLGPGRTEVTMVFQAHGVWCRGRADWLSDGPVMLPELGIEAPGGIDVDVKTVDNADALSWIKSVVIASALEVQASLRDHGHRAIAGVPRLHFWLLVEIGEGSTHDAQLVGVLPDLLDIGARKVRHAAAKWRQCLDANAWPGYGRKPVWAAAPSWAAWDLESLGIA